MTRNPSTCIKLFLRFSGSVRSMKSKVLVACALVATISCASVARADEAAYETHYEAHCEAIKGGSDELAQQTAIDRLLWVQRELNHEAWKARIWTWTFAATYSALIIGNGVHLILDHRTYNNKADNSVAVGGSMFGALVLAVSPPAVLRDQHKLAKVVSSWGDGKNACATLAEAETIFIRDAKSEAFARGPLSQMGNLGFNFALGIFIGTALHRWPTGFIVGPVAAMAGEVQLLSLPTSINDTLAQYRLGDLRERHSKKKPSWSLSPQITRGQVGVGGGIAF